MTATATQTARPVAPVGDSLAQEKAAWREGSESDTGAHPNASKTPKNPGRNKVLATMEVGFDWIDAFMHGFNSGLVSIRPPGHSISNPNDHLDSKAANNGLTPEIDKNAKSDKPEDQTEAKQADSDNKDTTTSEGPTKSEKKDTDIIEAWGSVWATAFERGGVHLGLKLAAKIYTTPSSEVFTSEEKYKQLMEIKLITRNYNAARLTAANDFKDSHEDLANARQEIEARYVSEIKELEENLRYKLQESKISGNVEKALEIVAGSLKDIDKVLFKDGRQASEAEMEKLGKAACKFSMSLAAEQGSKCVAAAITLRDEIKEVLEAVN
ncbi:MAG: hypothetical protein R3A13_08180 [Bdellovibrionota bacterium]